MNTNPTPALSFRRFELGQLVMTPGFARLFNEIDEAHGAGSMLVDMHASGDFGAISDSDRISNLMAIQDGASGRVLSASLAGKHRERVYVITEADRSVTTILLATEY